MVKGFHGMKDYCKDMWVVNSLLFSQVAWLQFRPPQDLQNGPTILHRLQWAPFGSFWPAPSGRIVKRFGGGWRRNFISWVYILTTVVGFLGWGGGSTPVNSNPACPLPRSCRHCGPIVTLLVFTQLFLYVRRKFMIVPYNEWILISLIIHLIQFSYFV